MWKQLFKLPRAVWLLGLVSFFNDSASELIYPLVPLYLSSVLMAGPKALGVIEGIAEATSSLLKLFSGIVTDYTHSAKPWVMGGYGLAALGRPLLALTTSWPGVLALRFADRVAKGLRTSPRDALVARVTPQAHRGLAFGLDRSLDNAGAMVGPLMAAWLLSMHMPLQRIFLWSIIPGAITVMLACLIKEPAKEPTKEPEPPEHNQPFNWSLRPFPAAYKRYLVTLALFTLGSSSNMFLLLRAKDMGISPVMVPLLWALTSASAMLLSAPLAGLSDKLGRNRLIICGWVVYGLFYLLLGLSHDDRLLWPLFAFYGVFMAATEGAEKALVADIAPRELLGTAYGWFNLIGGIMLLPASIVFGWLWQAFSPQLAFAFSASCALAAALLLHTWVIRR